MTTKVVIPRPTGDDCVRVFHEGDTYCAECDDAFSTDDWESKQIYDTESLGDWIKRHNPAIEPQDERSIYELFGSEGIREVTLTICPNGCEFFGGEGDSWWRISENQYVCEECNEWHEDPHYALLCCHGHDEENCHCTNMVEAQDNGQPKLIDGFPISRCWCGGGECTVVVCLVCHDYYDLDRHSLEYITKGHQHEGEWELAPPDELRRTMSFSIPQENIMSTTPKPPCEICGSYCCAIHKTHVSSHALCWESR